MGAPARAPTHVIKVLLKHGQLGHVPLNVAQAGAQGPAREAAAAEATVAATCEAAAAAAAVATTTVAATATAAIATVATRVAAAASRTGIASAGAVPTIAASGRRGAARKIHAQSAQAHVHMTQ